MRPTLLVAANPALLVISGHENVPVRFVFVPIQRIKESLHIRPAFLPLRPNLGSQLCA